ncbi:MFS transporter [bacterium]|nr:MFS transporter [bacterium]
MERRKIISLIAISSLGVISGSLIAPIEVRFIQTLVKDPGIVGLIFSLGTMFSFLFSIYVGRLSLRYGKRKMVLTGMLLGLIYPLLYATSLNGFQYLIGKMSWAFASVASWNMVNAIFQDEIRKSKQIAELSGWRFSAQSIAGTVGSLTGGYVADMFGLGVPYYLIILAYILAFVIFLKEFPVKKEKIIKKYAKRKISASFKDIISNPLLFFRFFTEGVTQSHWAMEPILFPIAIYSLTQSNFATGVVFGAMGIIAMFILPLTGKFVDRTSPISGLKTAFLFYTLALFLLAFSNTYIIFFIGALLLSIGKTFNGPSIAKIETEQIKSGIRGEYLGYFSAYDTATGAIVALATGYMLKFFGASQIFMIFCIFTIAGFLIGYVLFKRKSREYGKSLKW